MNSVSGKMILKNEGKIKHISDKRELKEFVARRPF